MKRIAIDMDDVMADATGQFVNYAQQRLEISITPEMIERRYSWVEVFPEKADEIRSWVHEVGYFRTMNVMPDAQEVVAKLMDRYEVFIVSAATEFPNSLKEKIEWLQEFFPFISWKNIVLCGHKYMIKADYLIDDHEKNLVAFTEGQPILYTAPHNLDIKGYTRVNNWREVEKLLL